MDRLYQIIGRHFSPGEIANLAGDLGIYIPTNTDPNSMARELFSGARRNLRLDVLFLEVRQRQPDLELDLRPNLYELIAGTFNEREAVDLARSLGLDRLNVGLDAGGLIGWNNDDFFKNRKAQTLQQTAEKQGKFAPLLVEMKKIRPALDLTIFQLSAAVQPEAQGKGIPDITDQEIPPVNPTDAPPGAVYNINNYYGDSYGGDRVEGDKTDGNVTKDVHFSDIKDSPVALGGDALIGNQAKDVKGDVTINSSSPERDALLELINLINKDLADIKTELRERDAQDAAEFLHEVENEIQTEKPDGSWIVRRLNTISQIAGAAGMAATAANQLGPHIQQAVHLAQTLFGG